MTPSTAPATIRRYKLRFALDGWRSASPIPMVRFEAAQGIVLGLLRHADPTATTRLHDANERKALSISPITIQSLPGGLAQAELLLAVWQPWLGTLLDTALQGATEARLTLGGVPALLLDWQILGAWDMAAAGNVPALPMVTARFTSPTLFGFGRYPSGMSRYHTLPDPGLVVASWLRAWKLTGDQSLDWMPPRPEELGQLIALEAIREMHTVTVAEPTARLTGFVGEVRYRWEGREPAGMQALAVLMRFAGICGTGAKTGRGFGQTTSLCPRPLMGMANGG